MGEHLTYILSVFEPAAFLNILLSTAFGIILGAIPGLGAGIGLALVMSFTYTMDPMSGLLMLGGIYRGAMYISEERTIPHEQTDHLSRRFRSLISERDSLRSKSVL